MLDTPEMHRNIFRGKNLGNAFTAQQKAAIANGSFDNLYVGDYWIINNVTWRIVDINYWLHTGDTECTTNHLVIMPDKSLKQAQMNTTRTTAGGYVGSKMFTEELQSVKNTIVSAFGASILLHREYLANTMVNGFPSNGDWYNSQVELPNEIMMYGCRMFSSAGDGNGNPCNYTIDNTQLALMRIRKEYINPTRETKWLRDPISDAHFASVNIHGNSGYQQASASVGVRPVFAIKGA